MALLERAAPGLQNASLLLRADAVRTFLLRIDVDQRSVDRQKDDGEGRGDLTLETGFEQAHETPPYIPIP